MSLCRRVSSCFVALKGAAMFQRADNANSLSISPLRSMATAFALK
jgi:hypothetical protein